MRRNWTKEEIQIIIDNHKIKSIKEIQLLLPGRSINSIEIKGNRLGIKFIKPRRLLNAEELNKFKEVYSTHKIKDILNMFPILNESQVTNLAYSMNLKKSFNNDIVKCTKCGQYLKYNNDNFAIRQDVKYCRECTRKIQLINKYKRDYGIELDFNKLYDTYNIYQWHYFLCKTPNEKKLKQLPYSLNTYDNALILFKYILEINNISDLNEIKKLTDCFLTSNNLKLKINNKHITVNKLILDTFKELKPWELKKLPVGYFRKDENIIEALTWFFTKNKLSKDYLINKSYYIDIDLFRENGLRMILERFNNSISDIVLFYLKKVYNDELKLSDINNFKDIVSRDGYSKCNSKEERKVFDFLKYEYGITNIKLISNIRSKNYKNKMHNEFYNPDFIITHDSKDKKLDKPIIIEYFGLWSENTYNSDLLVVYKKKTKRKVQYFTDRCDLQFVAIYPNDLKNNFKGVKEKLAPFYL